MALQAHLLSHYPCWCTRYASGAPMQSLTIHTVCWCTIQASWLFAAYQCPTISASFSTWLCRLTCYPTTHAGALGLPVHNPSQLALFCMLVIHHTCWLLHTALQAHLLSHYPCQCTKYASGPPMQSLTIHTVCWCLQPMPDTQPDIQPLSYWCPRHSLNLYPLTVCSSKYSKPLFVGSRAPGNLIPSTQCVCSLNCMVQYTVVSLCELLTSPSFIHTWLWGLCYLSPC